MENQKVLFENGKLEELQALFENLNLKTKGSVKQTKRTKVLFENLTMKKMFER